MSRKLLILLALLPVLALFNFAIWEKETILRDGETIFLRLAPVDPRSLMQGDYMRLRYQVAVEAEEILQKDTSDSSSYTVRHGHLVLRQGEDRKAEFVRIHSGKPLSDGEFLLPYSRSGTRFVNITIKPDSFFFQEGDAGIYEDARFGIFKLASDGAYLLTGLADETGKQIGN